MNNKIRRALILLGGFLFAGDRLLKFLSAGQWSEPRLLHPLFGWFPSQNHGIAFGIPIPNLLIIVISVIFIAVLIWFSAKHAAATVRAGIILILFGAFSNLLDRIFYGHTFDYFLTVTSIFNLADVMIVCGAVLCLLSLREHDQP